MSLAVCIFIPWEKAEDIPLYDGVDPVELLIKRFQPSDHIINIIGPPDFQIPQGNCISYDGNTYLQLIKHALNSIESERILLLGADQVRLTRDFTDYLQTLPDYYDIIIPSGMKYRPAIYSQSCLDKLNDLNLETKSLEDLCNGCETRYITEDEVYFYEDPEEMFISLKVDDFE